MIAGLAAALAISLILPFAQSCSIRKLSSQERKSSHELPREQGMAWSAIRQRWMHESFRRCLSASSIQLDCGGCISVRIPVHITIDETGSIHARPLPGGRSCAESPSPGLQRCFIDEIEKMQTPELLRQWEFDETLGTGLSC